MKTNIVTNAVYRFSVIPIKLPMAFFTELEQTVHMETQKTLNSQSSREKEEWSWRIHLPDFRLYYKVIVTKTVWCWHKNRSTDQWNKIGSQEISPYSYGHLIFDKEARIYNRAKTASSINGDGKTGQLHGKE